jgi:hypothetical protein
MNNVKPLSDIDIKKYLDNKVNVVLYNDLIKYKNIHQLLGKYGRCVILYIFEGSEGGSKSGHWVSVHKTPRGSIEFFDSYKTTPDHTLKTLKPDIKRKFNEDYNYLSKLLYDSKLPIEYNGDLTLQDDDSGVCGHHNICRLSFMDLPIEKYIKMFSKNKKLNDLMVYKSVVN